MIGKFNITFVDIDPKVHMAFDDMFQEYPNINAELINDFSDIETPFDVIITAGNSYGMMDGGFDDAVRRYFAQNDDGTYVIERAVQSHIQEEYNGFLPVGSATVVGYRDDTVGEKYVCYAPTMEVPKIVPPRNAYNAFYGALTALSQWWWGWGETSDINAICSAFCTHTGKVDPMVSARQMKLAYDHFMKPLNPYGWTGIVRREFEINAVNSSSLVLERFRE
jgi:O-acetyl-ADP-ribose deacetylase (regulator of RNase III)